MIVLENGLAAVAAVHDVVNGSGVLDAQLSSHAASTADARPAVYTTLLGDPFTVLVNYQAVPMNISEEALSRQQL